MPWLVGAVLAAVGSYVLFHRSGLLLDSTAPIVSTTVLVFADLLVDTLRRARPSADRDADVSQHETIRSQA